MESFEEKANRLPPKAKLEMENYMDLILGIKNISQYKENIANELEGRLNDNNGERNIDEVMNELAAKYGIDKD